MKRVIIESPLSGDVEANVAYLDRCYLDTLKRGEAPIASHGSRLVHVLDDLEPADRALGIKVGVAWHEVAELVVFYVDRGMSRGMVDALEHVVSIGVPWEFRRLGEFRRGRRVKVEISAEDKATRELERLEYKMAREIMKRSELARGAAELGEVLAGGPLRGEVPTGDAKDADDYRKKEHAKRHGADRDDGGGAP